MAQEMTKAQLQEQLQKLQAQLEAQSKGGGAAQPKAGVSSKNPQYLWVRHPKVKSISKKSGKEYIPTVSMPKEALLAMLNDDQVREDLAKAVQAIQA